MLGYIYGPGGLPVEQINSSTEAVTYLHHDHAGSTRLLTSSTGTVTGAYTYTPYGATEAHTGTATIPLGYDGQLTSSDTGLIYLRARTYDPNTAQFLSVDPMLPVTGAPYTYGSDNPLNVGDPSGLCNANPFSESFWTQGNCISESPLNPLTAIPRTIYWSASFSGTSLPSYAGQSPTEYTTSPRALTVLPGVEQQSVEAPEAKERQKATQPDVKASRAVAEG